MMIDCLTTEAQRTQRSITFPPGGRRRPAERHQPLRGRKVMGLQALCFCINRDFSPQGLSFFVRPPSPGRTKEIFSLCSLCLRGESNIETAPGHD
jgi:hypothetical protein